MKCVVCGEQMDRVVTFSHPNCDPGEVSANAQALDSMALRRYLAAKMGPAVWPLSTEEE